MFKVNPKQYDHDTVIHSSSGFKCACEDWAGYHYWDPQQHNHCCATGVADCVSCVQDATYWYASDDIYFCESHKPAAETSDHLLEV